MSKIVICKLAPRQLGRQTPIWQNVILVTGVIGRWRELRMLRDIGFMILCLLIVSMVSQLTADTISSWGFNYTSTPTAGTLIYSDEGTASLTYNYAGGYEINPYGTDVNQEDSSNPNKCFLLWPSESTDSGQILLNCNTLGFTDIQLSYATYRSVTGAYKWNNLYYSTDNGATFSSKIELQNTVVGAWNTINFDLKGVQGVNNLGSVVLRLVLSSSTHKGFNRIDNLKITGIPIQETLPCELHAFTASPSVQNSVNLSWITHSETGLLGFKLYRNNTNNLSSAIQVSPLISASNSSTTQTYCYIDTELSQAGTYYYWLEIMEGSGFSSYTQPVTLLWNPVSQPDPPPCFDDNVFRVYPNPFNADTTIHYELSKASDMSLEVFNARGQKIRTLEQSSRPAGSYNVVWDGLDGNGSLCASGVYRLVLVHDGIRSERKVILLQ